MIKLLWMASLMLLLMCPLLVLSSTNVMGGQAANGDFAKRRKEMLNRRRRVIFNNDGGDALGFPAGLEVNAENLLSLRTTPLVGSHVDTIFYCTGHGFGYHIHDTKVGTVLDGYEGGVSGVRPLIEQGNDALKVMVDYCHANGIEIFRSQRMNDRHDRSHTPDNPNPEFSPFKQQHPECLVSTIDNPPTHAKYDWTGADYTHPEVRDAMYSYLEEVCQNYDVDGIEMDFWRAPLFFKSVAFGGQASDKELDMMTDLVRRVREMTEREGQRRGRPLLVAVRVPDSLGYCRGIGLDLERWMEEGLVDLLIPGDSIRQWTPWEQMIKLGHRYGVKVYPSLQRPVFPGEAPPFSRNSAQSYRAKAMKMWQSGADGVYLFNYLRPKQWWPWLREIGEPDVLARLDKTYYATYSWGSRLARGDGSPEYFLAGGGRFVDIPMLTPDDPITVEPGKTVNLDVRVGDDLDAAVKKGLQPQVACHLMAADNQNLSVRLNGVTLEKRISHDNVWLEFPLEPKLVRPGVNRVEFELGAGANEGWSVRDIVISVQFPKAENSKGPQ